MSSNVVAGAVIAVLAAFAACQLRHTAEYGNVAGGQRLVGRAPQALSADRPFVVPGSIGSGAPMWSNVVGGLLAAILAAYAGYAVHTGG